MKDSFFRKASIEKISSPEQLNDYIKVSNPSVWVILGAMIILLSSVCVWGFYGSLNTVISINGIVKDGILTCYIDEKDIDKIKEGMLVKVGDFDGKINFIESVPKSKKTLEGELDEYQAYKLSLKEWNYKLLIDAAQVEDGIHPASIVLEAVKPMSFILN